MFRVHNPAGAAVNTIHLVQSAHLDIGCKTFGCSARLTPGEPDLCLGHHVEPYAYHIVNRFGEPALGPGSTRFAASDEVTTVSAAPEA